MQELPGGGGHSVGVALRGAHELSTGEGTTPLPPSPFLAPATFSTSRLFFFGRIFSSCSLQVEVATQEATYYKFVI